MCMHVGVVQKVRIVLSVSVANKAVRTVIVNLELDRHKAPDVALDIFLRKS